MNQEQALGLLRWALAAVGPTVLATGLVSPNAWTIIGSVATTLLPAVWTMFVHTDANTVKSAATVPGVQVHVSPSASESVKAVAADPNVRDVVPAGASAMQRS